MRLGGEEVVVVKARLWALESWNGLQGSYQSQLGTLRTQFDAHADML